MVSYVYNYLSVGYGRVSNRLLCLELWRSGWMEEVAKALIHSIDNPREASYFPIIKELVFFCDLASLQFQSAIHFYTTVVNINHHHVQLYKCIC